MKNVLDLLAARGTAILLVGFTIIAIDAGVFGFMAIKNKVTSHVQDWMFVVGLVGFAIYAAGRIGVAIQRRNARKVNEFKQTEPKKDTGDNQ